MFVGDKSNQHLKSARNPSWGREALSEYRGQADCGREGWRADWRWRYYCMSPEPVEVLAQSAIGICAVQIVCLFHDLLKRSRIPSKSFYLVRDASDSNCWRDDQYYHEIRCTTKMFSVVIVSKTGRLWLLLLKEAYTQVGWSARQRDLPWLILQIGKRKISPLSVLWLILQLLSPDRMSENAQKNWKFIPRLFLDYLNGWKIIRKLFRDFFVYLIIFKKYYD